MLRTSPHLVQVWGLGDGVGRGGGDGGGGGSGMDGAEHRTC